MSRDFAQLHGKRQREEREAWRPRRDQYTSLDLLRERAQLTEWRPKPIYFTGPRDAV